jgi:large subunit ribosomal protein L23
MDAYEVIIRPLITEKSVWQSGRRFDQTGTKPARGGTYTFEVHPKANKAQVRDAIQRIYNVKVMDVRTGKQPGKRRRYRYTIGVTTATKKAVVTLHPDYHIDLF